MDCMEGMRQFPDKYFDLAIVDPPYGIGESGKKNGTRSKLATSKDYPEFYGKDREPPGGGILCGVIPGKQESSRVGRKSFHIPDAV